LTPIPVSAGLILTRKWPGRYLPRWAGGR